jgi:hypothetical protein
VTIGGHIEVHIPAWVEAMYVSRIRYGDVGESSMYRHGLKKTVIERLSTSHMLIVIEKTQSTFVPISSHVMIVGVIVNCDRVITKQLEGC